jgi:sugar lactone lactonase YvrE
MKQRSYTSVFLILFICTLLNSMESKGQVCDGNLNKVCEIKAKLGEGSIWDKERGILYWIDIENGILYEYDPVSEKILSHAAGKKIGTIVPESGESVVLALEDGIYRMNLVNDQLEFLAKPSSLRKDQRFNDGKCDPAGRLWVGSMGPSRSGFLYCMNNEGAIEEVLNDITTSNGLIWSLDSTKMYYIDTNTSRVRQFDYNIQDGSLRNEKIIIEIPGEQGYPDGMTIDSEGKLWIALWGGSGVNRYDPETGDLLQKIELPAKNVTSCAFGGKDLDILYITTAYIGLSDTDQNKQPDAGKLFCIKTGYMGIPSNPIKLY